MLTSQGWLGRIVLAPAAVAQLDRALRYERRGRGFESLQWHMKAVLFTAEWCSFCKRLKPHTDKYDIEYLDIDLPENLSKLQELGLQTIPTLVVYEEDGAVRDKLVNPNPIQVAKALE